MTRRHAWINGGMLAESALLHAVFSTMTLHGFQQQALPWMVAGVVLQGVWLQRAYCVGHEASHKKLFADRPWLNDLIGQLFLFLILVPLPVFRAIHRFHHGANRRDPHTSALEVYVVTPGDGRMKRLQPWVLWYLAVFAGGWFFHGLVSVLLFLFCPPHVARRISPAFSGWTWRRQGLSILLFGLPILGHVALAMWGGAMLWWLLLGAPVTVFAWVYSVQLYVYHYKTTIGPQTPFHARRLDGGRLVSWWLLNLNEHDTHHQQTKVVWYALPEHARPLPAAYAANQNVHRFRDGLLQQLGGPRILEKE